MNKKARKFLIGASLIVAIAGTGVCAFLFTKGRETPSEVAPSLYVASNLEVTEPFEGTIFHAFVYEKGSEHLPSIRFAFSYQNQDEANKMIYFDLSVTLNGELFNAFSIAEVGSFETTDSEAMNSSFSHLENPEYKSGCGFVKTGEETRGYTAASASQGIIRTLEVTFEPNENYNDEDFATYQAQAKESSIDLKLSFASENVFPS